MNNILLSLALGGHYLLPSRRAILTLLLSTPILILMHLGLFAWAQNLLLPVYSISFTITTMLILSLIHSRGINNWPRLTYIQLNSPERNLFAANTLAKRFKNWTEIPLQLPFFGEWQVSQGYHGKITHQNTYQYALDFIVSDVNGINFRHSGQQLTDYLCYGLPLTAPFEGEIVFIKDGVVDNDIGDNDLINNWGNTIIIKHTSLTYSKLSHIQPGTIQVTIGEKVKTGQVIARCGNSGRSPEPHLHFQVQTNDRIDGATIPYPISSLILNNKNRLHFKTYYVPNEGDRIIPAVSNPTLKQAFQFYEGMFCDWKVVQGNQTYHTHWEVQKDSYGQLYIHDHESDTILYILFQDQFMKCGTFIGPHKGLLFEFYKALHTVPYCSIENLVIEDVVCSSVKSNWLTDFISIYKPATTFNYSSTLFNLKDEGFIIKSQIQYKKSTEIFETIIKNGSINSIKNLQTNLCATLISA